MDTNIKEPVISTNLMARIAIITALLCVLSPFSIPLPFSPVPLSLANFVLFLSVFVLKPKAAALSTLLYLLIGAVGLPVFSGFSGGLGKLAGPTGGYLVGYVPLVIILAIFMQIGIKRRWYIFYIVGIILGETVLYILGTAWLSHSLQVTFYEGLGIAVIPYLPGDAIKALLAMKIGHEIRKVLIKSTGKDPIG